MKKTQTKQKTASKKLVKNTEIKTTSKKLVKNTEIKTDSKILNFMKMKNNKMHWRQIERKNNLVFMRMKIRPIVLMHHVIG